MVLGIWATIHVPGPERLRAGRLCLMLDLAEGLLSTSLDGLIVAVLYVEA
jgi:hypothetical protein